VNGGVAKVAPPPDYLTARLSFSLEDTKAAPFSCQAALAQQADGLPMMRALEKLTRGRF